MHLEPCGLWRRPTSAVASEKARSSPCQRRWGQDSTATGKQQVMLTRPGADLRSPAAQDTLLSSPPVMPSSVIPLDFVVSSPLTCGTLSSWIEGTPSSGGRGTPMRQRPDPGSAQNGLQVDFQYGPATEDIVAGEQLLGQNLLIWGTDVNMETCKTNLQRFYWLSG